MAWVNNKKCFFFITNGNCMIDKSHCLFCSGYQKKIEDLDLRDHLNLAIAKQSSRASLLIAWLALLVSLASVYVDVTNAIASFAK